MVIERTQGAPPLSSEPGQALPPRRHEQAAKVQLCRAKAEGGRLRVRPPVRSQETGPPSSVCGRRQRSAGCWRRAPRDGDQWEPPTSLTPTGTWWGGTDRLPCFSLMPAWRSPSLRSLRAGNGDPVKMMICDNQSQQLVFWLTGLFCFLSPRQNVTNKSSPAFAY